MTYRDLEHRLLARSALIPEGEPHAGCWMWLGRVEKNGYAKIGFYLGGGRAGEKVRGVWVHRLVCEELRGEPIPKGHTAHHICHFRLCINPEHLRVVTAKANYSEGAIYGNRQRYG